MFVSLSDQGAATISWTLHCFHESNSPGFLDAFAADAKNQYVLEMLVKEGVEMPIVLRDAHFAGSLWRRNNGQYRAQSFIAQGFAV